nr:ATP-binding protein [Lysinibacillus timonensis]
MMSKKVFWSTITFYIVLGVYLFYITIPSPFAGIIVEKQDEDWVITDFTFSELAEKHHINKGDILLEVNGDRNYSSYKLKTDHEIRSAQSLKIKTTDGEIREVKVAHEDLIFLYLNLLILPICYFLIALFLAIYLYNHKKGNTSSLNLLILFILSLSLAYSSIAVATRMERIGVIVNSTLMILSPVLLLHFIKNYFLFLGIKWKILNKVIWLYSLPVLILLLTILEGPFPTIYGTNTLIILTVFLFLSILLLIIFGISYYKYPKTQIKLLFWGIILPFLPFLLLYVIPLILFERYIVDASISALFLLFIPLGFIFAQFSERLFDMKYHISRFRYYVFYSLFLTLLLMVGILLFVSISTISIESILGLTMFIFILLLVGFYIKEKLDYVNRKVLFSSDGDYNHLLYSTIEKIGKSVKQNEIYEQLTSILVNQLELDIVYIVKYDVQNKLFRPFQDETKHLHHAIDLDIIEHLQLREIKKIGSVYIACLHQDMCKKDLLLLGSKNNTQLKHEELLWLELLILFINSFIDNTKLVEDLLSELKVAQQKENHQPTWLKKLLWLQIDDVKCSLSQELHDTILQEQIFLIRELDILSSELTSEQLQPKAKILNIKEQLVSINNQLRTFCEQLKPPLIDTLGLKAALKKLFMQTQKRADFTLIHSIEEIETNNSQIPLVIYRIIQEMLSNAMKHSQATYVKIDLKPLNDGFKIFYMDNGVGFDTTKIDQLESMGLRGIKERVLAYNGQIEIDTYPNEGMQIHIQVKEG